MSRFTIYGVILIQFLVHFLYRNRMWGVFSLLIVVILKFFPRLDFFDYEISWLSSIIIPEIQQHTTEILIVTGLLALPWIILGFFPFRENKPRFIPGVLDSNLTGSNEDP